MPTVESEEHDVPRDQSELREPQQPQVAEGGVGVTYDIVSGTFKSTDPSRTEAVIAEEYNATMAEAAALKGNGNAHFNAGRYDEALVAYHGAKQLLEGDGMVDVNFGSDAKRRDALRGSRVGGGGAVSHHHIATTTISVNGNGVTGVFCQAECHVQLSICAARRICRPK